MGLPWSSIVSWCLTDRRLRLRVCAGLDDGSVALYDTRNMKAAPAIKVSTQFIRPCPLHFETGMPGIDCSTLVPGV